MTYGQEYNKRTSEYLSKDEDDLPYGSPTVSRTRTFPVGEEKPAPAEVKKGKGKKWNLEEVERWTMVKRIW